MLARTLVVIAVVLAQRELAHAQWTNPFTGNTFNNPMSSYMDTAIQNSQRMAQLRFRQQQERWQREDDAKRAGRPPPAKTDARTESRPDGGRAPFVLTDFKPGARVLPALLARGERTPQARATKIKAYTEILDGYETDKTIRKHNVAYAMAVLIGVSTMIRDQRQIDDDVARSLALGLDDAVGASEDFKKLADKHKQAIYETCVIYATIVVAAASSSDETTRKRARQLATDILKSFGV